MMHKLHLAAFVAIAGLMPLATASAQTSTTTTTTVTTTTTGSFQSLSPGNQKIARALFESQHPSATGTAPLDLNQIADRKSGTGWGNVFKQMKAKGLIDAKNLGQVVSTYEHGLSHSAALGVGNSGGALTVTTGTGRTTDIDSGHAGGGGAEAHGDLSGGHHDEGTTNAGGASLAATGAVSAGGGSHGVDVGAGHGH